MVLLVDEATNFVSLLVSVLSERQAELLKYVQATYSNVSVFVQDNWLRLDFNSDGKVSMDDLRKGLTELYEFLKSYDYIEATQKIKSAVYEEAQKYIKTNKVQADAGDIPITEEASKPVDQLLTSAK